MYINPYNRITDEATIIDFVRQHSFGILINAQYNIPSATHLPFDIAETAGKTALRTHVAKANPQWRQLDTDTEVLVIFGGPHAYISPRWYDHINVPTMNYVAVHAYGKPRLIDSPEEVYELLKSQIEQHETKLDEYNVQTLPPDFLKAEMRALVGLEIIVDRWEGNFKLSQNRDEKNYQNIVAELEKTGNQTGIVAAMREVYEDKGFKQ